MWPFRQLLPHLPSVHDGGGERRVERGAASLFPSANSPWQAGNADCREEEDEEAGSLPPPTNHTLPSLSATGSRAKTVAGLKLVVLSSPLLFCLLSFQHSRHGVLFLHLPGVTPLSSTLADHCSATTRYSSSLSSSYFLLSSSGCRSRILCGLLLS